MPDVFSHFLMRLYPLARRTGLTITTIPRHGRRDVPSHSTRLPADRPIIEATSVLIFPTLSLSRRVTIRITWRESTKLEEEENEIYDLDLRNRRDRRSFIYFCSVSFYRELLEWINGKRRREFSIRELFKEERKK